MKPINVVVLGNNRPDLEMMTMYISESLKKQEGYKAKVTGFIDPRKACEHIEKSGCDVLFSEAELCGVDGLILLREIQKSHPKINIVITTSYEEYIIEAVRMQIRLAGYMPLPITSSKTEGMLDNILTFQQIADAV